jgi:hypothetical protein
VRNFLPSFWQSPTIVFFGLYEPLFVSDAFFLGLFTILCILLLSRHRPSYLSRTFFQGSLLIFLLEGKTFFSHVVRDAKGLAIHQVFSSFFSGFPDIGWFRLYFGCLAFFFVLPRYRILT